MAGLSQRAYAAHRGVSHTAVQRAIREGRISTFSDGRIDPAVADEEWEQNTLYGKGGGPAQFVTARTVHETYRARLAKLDYEERIAKLLPRDEVAAAAFKRYREFRDHMLNIPNRIAPVLAAETDPARVHDILAAEIRDALGEFASQAGGPDSP
jgi:hypothetical protein